MKDVIKLVTIGIIFLAAGYGFQNLPEQKVGGTTDTYRYDYKGGTLNIYLTDEIEDRPEYLSLVQLLHHNKDREVRVYLEGNGGYVNSAMTLWYAFKSHPKTVTTVVYGNVYSAHAMLAFAGHKIEIPNKSVLLMFHVPAIMGATVEEFCWSVTGKDRGVPRQLKCYEMEEVLDKQYKLTVFSVLGKVLSKEELKKFNEGHDVYVDGGTILKRYENALLSNN